MQTPSGRSGPFLDELNRTYNRLHTAKEDAFWTVHMGLSDDVEAAQAALTEAERAMSAFVTDPARLAEVRAVLAAADAPSDEERLALEGWIRTFEANVMESAEARRLWDELSEDEGRMNTARGRMKLGYVDPDDGFVEASSVKLSVMLGSEADERKRRAAWEGLRSIETYVLEHGFLDLVRKRNRWGRAMGGEDFYDATVRRTEGMTKAEVFARLDELEEKTRDAAEASLAALAREKGLEKIDPWSFRWLVSGDVTAEKDPHFPFGPALERWMRSFAALGIDYRGATLVLDLVDRKGKYENGFMHGPVLSWRDHGAWRPARIQFTANAIPGMVGSGQGASETLFHEGGHAAHFANIDMPSPCFSTEFAPSSVAMAETQSMFLDSLLGDADWQTRYARTADGTEMPFALIEKAIRAGQPHAAFGLRSMLSVCYAERAIYELPEDELTPERVLAVLREVERRFCFMEAGGPRPVLSVPHLLSNDSSAYYHGYVLAEMAVEQTRRHFEERDGHLTDNPRIGPELRDAYWREGNLRRFSDFVERLTGRPLSADDLAARATRSVDEAVAKARERIERLADVPAFEGAPRLNAEIRVQHGNETIASIDQRDGGADADVAAFTGAFTAWVDRRASGGA
ncbi:MAG: M3 family metallopeptidase [Planctomycetota bacterium JB042]